LAKSGDTSQKPKTGDSFGKGKPGDNPPSGKFPGQRKNGDKSCAKPEKKGKNRDTMAPQFAVTLECTFCGKGHYIDKCWKKQKEDKKSAQHARPKSPQQSQKPQFSAQAAPNYSNFGDNSNKKEGRPDFSAVGTLKNLLLHCICVWEVLDGLLGHWCNCFRSKFFICAPTPD
jgi:hypothetical protein